MGFLLGDVVLTALPVIPAGIGPLAKAGKAGYEAARDVEKVKGVAEIAADTARASERGMEAGEGIARAEQGISEATRIVEQKPSQLHHFATNKNRYFTQQMEKIVNRFGLDLEGSWNKAVLPQLGRHPNDYHDFVLEGMRQAASQAGNADEFIQLFNDLVVKPVTDNPDLLYKIGWPK